MRLLMVGFFVLGSFSSFAGNQCNKLANQELEAARLVGEFRYQEYNQISKEMNSKIKRLEMTLLESASNNFTQAVFNTVCETDIEAVNETIYVLSSSKESQLAQAAIVELLKLKL